ncbi:MAG: aldose 1-epimerase [Candidatus Dormibacteria bacterium]
MNNQGGSVAGAAVRTEVADGWEVVVLGTDSASVTLVPGKGGDILSFISRRLELDVLWKSPWGLRPPSDQVVAPGSNAAFMHRYPGGWQTLFPNGGDECDHAGVRHGFHGEAAMARWDWRPLEVGGGAAVELTTRLETVPVSMRREVRLDDATLTVTETAENEGGEPLEVMWVQHPAFGAPFIGPGCTVSGAATTIVVDDARDTLSGDLAVGARGSWPLVPGRHGEDVDLSRVPGEDQPCDRFAYLTGFSRGHMSIESPAVGLAVDLDWDASVLPHAWYWLEAHGSTEAPWHGEAYVLAIEPASSFPGRGLHTVTETTGTQIVLEPGQARTVTVACTLRPLAA